MVPGQTPTAQDAVLAADKAIASENTVLRLRLAQLEEALRAIRGSEVDALFVAGAGGGQVFALDGADRAYRVLIEQMGQGALTLTPDGIVVYANRSFAELVGRPLGSVIGARIESCFAPEGHAALAALLREAKLARRNAEMDILGASGIRVPVLLSVSRLAIEGLPDSLCMVATDLTEQRRSEAASVARQTLLKVIDEQKRTEKSLQATLATLRLHDNALGAISQGVMICDAELRTTYVNKACEAISGYPARERIGRHSRILDGPGTSFEALAALSAAIAAAVPFHGELLHYRKDGTPFWNELSVMPVFDEAGALTQFVTLSQDVTARRTADAQTLLAAKVFEQSGEGLMITDAQRNIVKVNPAFTAITGFTEEDALGQNPRMLSSGRHDPVFYQAMWAEIESKGRWQGEVWNRRKDGIVYPQWMSTTRVVNTTGQPTHYIASFSDITQRKQAEENIQRLAHFDSLTGLPNRALLGDRATQALRAAHRNDEPVALMFIDLDHFKNVNDALGHAVGDQLLVALAARFKGALRDQDTLSRIGGDEFVLLLPGTDATDAAHVAHKLLQLAQQPYQIEQHELTITPSIGISIYPLDGADFDALAKCADAAMYRAKQDGRNTFCFHTTEIQAESARLPLIENALRRALERGQLQLNYQPQRALRGDRIVGAEALLRWQHPELGSVSPAEFIPIAERSGLIAPIGEWVLRTAVRQMKAWIDGGMAPIVMAVNLSAVQFRQHELPELVHRILGEAGLPPQYLELELTESVASHNPMQAVEVMNRLRGYGVRMSIDDFGTGYSSLSYLKRFKIHKLKIDQSFVRGVTDDTDDQAIVTAIIGMARSLSIQTIAEGVETVQQMEYLRDQGCDEMQGYWFSRPLTAEQFQLFARHHEAPAG